MDLYRKKKNLSQEIWLYTLRLIVYVLSRMRDLLFLQREGIDIQRNMNMVKSKIL